MRAAPTSRPSGATRAADVAPRRPLLAFDGVSMTFPDGTRALDGISFDVAAGELVAIVGPSGCGKSTLLRIASGLLEASAGSVDVEAAAVGHVFQDPTLLPWRTVRRNVELLAELDGMDRADRARRADEVLGLVGLDDMADKYPKHLSGGMRMRVSLARSLMLQPDVFLFDEPFGALDEITRERLNDDLLQLFVRRRFATVFVTHSVYEAAFLSSRVLVLSARPGRIAAEVPIPFEYPRSPDLRFDAAFATVCGEVSHALRGAGG